MACRRLTALRIAREQELLGAAEQPIAVMVPAWDESAVIGRMVGNFLKSVTYSNYHVFVGTYPNDPGTQREVDVVTKSFANVHRVVCPNNGPTCKSDCLNWIYQAILEFERETSVTFAMFVIHDAEDLPHPLSFKLFSRLIPRYDMNWSDDVFFDPTEGKGLAELKGYQPGAVPPYAIGQKAFFLHNVRVAYRTPTGNVEVGGFVRNLTDEVYKTFVFDAASLSGLIINFVGEPRTYGIDIRIDF